MPHGRRSKLVFRLALDRQIVSGRLLRPTATDLTCSSWMPSVKVDVLLLRKKFGHRRDGDLGVRGLGSLSRWSSVSDFILVRRAVHRAGPCGARG